MKFFILSTVVDVVIAIGASKELKSPVSAFAELIGNGEKLRSVYGAPQEYESKEKYIKKIQDARHNIKSSLHDKKPDQLFMARSVYGVRLRPIVEPALRSYDRVLNVNPTWDQKTINDQYKNLKRYMNNTRMDEDNREIPILSNSDYGHRLHAKPEVFKRAHQRVKHFHDSIYRNNGVM